MSEKLLRHPVSLSKRTLNMGHKIPYVDVISDAILASPNRRLTAKEIFELVSAKYGPMKKAETLKNTIRHTLSRYKVFRKVQRGRQKKPNWWTVDEGVLFASGQPEHGDPTEWGSHTTVSVAHAVQSQPAPAPPFYGTPNYLPIPNRPLVIFGNGPLAQNPEYKAPFAFQEPSRTGQVYSSGCFSHPEMPGQFRAAPMTAPVLPYCQPPSDVRTRGGHYVISVEDFAAGALSSTESVMLPIQPSFAFT